MTLEAIWESVVFLSEGKIGKKLNIEEFNDILALVDYDLMEEYVGQPNKQTGYETDLVFTDALLPFKSSSTISLTTGAGTLPTDYLHFSKCHYVSGSDIIPVELVTTQESEQRRFNAITLPSLRFPIFELTSSTAFQVYPTSISSVVLGYIKKPTPSSLVLKSENGVYVYDSTNSVQPQWNASQHNAYIRHILKYLGISVNDQFITQYVESKQAQTT